MDIPLFWGLENMSYMVEIVISLDLQSGANHPNANRRLEIPGILVYYWRYEKKIVLWFYVVRVTRSSGSTTPLILKH